MASLETRAASVVASLLFHDAYFWVSRCQNAKMPKPENYWKPKYLYTGLGFKSVKYQKVHTNQNKIEIRINHNISSLNFKRLCAWPFSQICLLSAWSIFQECLNHTRSMPEVAWNMKTSGADASGNQVFE